MDRCPIKMAKWLAGILSEFKKDLNTSEIVIEEQIVQKLKALEIDYGVKVLLAVESGSRVWGFESQNSDYDVRFIFVRRSNDYLSIQDKRDVIEWMSEDRELDFSGWDLRKTLQLFRKSNPPLMEWLRSPVVYLEQGDAASKLRELSSEFFSPRKCLSHYYHMGKNNWQNHLSNREQVKFKKYFYALRPILCCMWIEKEGTVSPIEFGNLLELISFNSELNKAISALLEQKKAGAESNMGQHILSIDDFLTEQIKHFQQYTRVVQDAKVGDVELLNTLFRTSLY